MKYFKCKDQNDSVIMITRFTIEFIYFLFIFSYFLFFPPYYQFIFNANFPVDLAQCADATVVVILHGIVPALKYLSYLSVLRPCESFVFKFLGRCPCRPSSSVLDCHISLNDFTEMCHHLAMFLLQDCATLASQYFREPNQVASFPNNNIPAKEWFRKKRINKGGFSHFYANTVLIFPYTSSPVFHKINLYSFYALRL